jgi:hypothetical protein
MIWMIGLGVLLFVILYAFTRYWTDFFVVRSAARYCDWRLLRLRWAPLAGAWSPMKGRRYKVHLQDAMGYEGVGLVRVSLLGGVYWTGMKWPPRASGEELEQLQQELAQLRLENAQLRLELTELQQNKTPQ